ncbi:MAG: hypothetical protein KF678_10915 [Phycisphaeraceae bacterium]|nr:hypothetical protein [Phycisphaeraceae bacterium]
MIRHGVTSGALSDFFASGRVEAPGLLPRLVKRLIDATTDDLGLLRMPGGDDVGLPGWDGRTEHSGGHPYIPVGEAAWEMGVDSRPSHKATSDYRKRTETPRLVNPASTTFVFVTPHRWPTKDRWVTTKTAEGAWRDIRVIDGPTLSEWLERAPAVTAWMCNQMGRSVDELDDLEFAWVRRVESKYGSRVTPELVIGGRAAAASHVARWLAQPEGHLTIAAESADEVIDFVAAVARQAQDVPLASRVLFAQGASCQHYLSGLQVPHVVVLEDASISGRLPPRAFPWIRTVTPTSTRLGRPQDADVVLPRLKRDAVAKALVAAGIDDHHAGRMASECGGSLKAAIWMVQAGNPDLPWLVPRAAAELAPLVLAGGWIDVECPDHEVIASLAERPYAEVGRLAMQWREPDGPMELAEGEWGWIAWRFVWQRLAQFITPALSKRFAETAVSILGEPDPSLDLPQDERWLASLRGKKHRYSESLRRGLVRSIAMFGSQQEHLRGVDGKAVAGGIVRRLLESGDQRAAWLSLASWLPSLAEAAPEVFCRAAEAMIKDNGIVLELFKEYGVFMGGRHTGLLWALEAVAWSPDYLARAVLILGHLAELDPGGQLANRPAASLRSIMLPWRPATQATVEQRLGALDQLIRKFPEPAFTCCLGLLPRRHDSTMTSGGPGYQAWKGPTRALNRAEYWACVDGVVDRLIAMAESDPQRWSRLVAFLPELMKSRPAKAAEVVRALEFVDRGVWQRECRLAVHERLRELVEANAIHAEEDWAVNETDLKTLEHLAQLTSPSSARDRHRWLFTLCPRSRELDTLSFEDEQKQLRVLRGSAVDDVIKEESLDAVISWANEVGDPGPLGAALAWSTLRGDPWLIIARTVLAEQPTGPPTKEHRLGFGFIRAMEQEGGQEWRSAALARLHAANDLGAMLRFVECLWPTQDLWQRLEADFPELCSRYWGVLRIHYLHAKEALWAIPRLLKAGRLLTVLELISTALHDNRSNCGGALTPDLAKLCEQVLSAASDHPSEESPGTMNAGMVGHGLEDLLEFAEQHAAEIPGARDLMERCEWRWLPALQNSVRGYRALSKALAESPEFFVDLLALVFRGENEPNGDAPLEEPEHEMWRRAHQVLDAWRFVPGLDLGSAVFGSRAPHRFHEGDPTVPFVKGQVDAEALQKWIAVVRKLADSKGRLKVADSQIGQVFAYAPADADGAWPCKAVRDCIGAISSDVLDRGFACEIRNRRGAHYLGDDGSEERRLRDAYRAMADRIDKDGARAAAVLRSVADWYDSEARRNDEEGHGREFRN